MSDATHKELDRRYVGARPKQEEAEQLPQIDDDEAGAWRDMPGEGAHGSLSCSSGTGK